MSSASLPQGPAAENSAVAQRNQARPGKLPRLPELDALRGFFLVWMTLTHLPIQLGNLVNQPVGFFSSADGFIFLSALLVGRIYIRKVREDSLAVHRKLWKRSLWLYGYQVLLLTLAFTAAAPFAVNMHAPALLNLLDFYLAHPGRAIAGSLLLIYCPPLLDILPMYIILLALSPTILWIADRKGWGRVLLGSGVIWLLAQFGLRAWFHHLTSSMTGLDIPLHETGAFNLFAWQALWIIAMWVGAKSADGENPLARLPRFAAPFSVAVCLFFVGIRYDWLGGHLTPQVLGMLLNKWQMGALRIVNLAAFACLVFWLRRYIARMVMVRPFPLLGKASLEVFCAHLLFVFAGLGLIADETTQIHGLPAICLVLITFPCLILVAFLVTSRRDRRKTRAYPTDRVDGCSIPVD